MVQALRRINTNTPPARPTNGPVGVALRNRMNPFKTISRPAQGHTSPMQDTTNLLIRRTRLIQETPVFPFDVEQIAAAETELREIEDLLLLRGVLNREDTYLAIDL